MPTDPELKKQGRAGDLPGSPVVRNPCFLTARAPGSICGWGTKSPHAVQCGQENKKIKNKTGTCTPSCSSSSENQVSSQTQRPPRALGPEAWCRPALEHPTGFTCVCLHA